MGTYMQNGKPKQRKNSKAKNKNLESIIATYFDFFVSHTYNMKMKKCMKTRNFNVQKTPTKNKKNT